MNPKKKSYEDLTPTEKWNWWIANLVYTTLAPRGFKKNNMKKEVAILDFLSQERVYVTSKKCILVTNMFRLHITDSIIQRVKVIEEQKQNLVKAKTKLRFYQFKTRKSINLQLNKLHSKLYGYNSALSIINDTAPPDNLDDLV